MLAQTNGAGETTLRSYDSNGNQLTETDPLGNTRSWSYDAVGNVLTETNPAGETTTSTYGPFNQLDRQTDPLGHVVMESTYRNTTVGGEPVYPGPLGAITDANGSTTLFSYDGAGNLSGIVDPEGAETSMEYDGNGFVSARVDADGHRTEIVNDVMGRVLSESTTRTRADGTLETLVTGYTLDAKGRVIVTTYPDGSTSTTDYDGNDKPVTQCDALNRCTQMTYSDVGNLIRTDYADGSFDSTDYDANGNVIAQTDRGGRTTRMVYDAANRLVETIYPDPGGDDGIEANNPRSRSVYDAAGRLSESIDENGNRTRYEYDAAGRQIAVVDAGGARSTSEYDAAGRKVAKVDALGHRTSFDYDDGGRLLATTYSDGTRTATEYDGASRRTAQVAADGQRAEYGYDPAGRLTEVRQFIEGRTLITSYDYDEAGNKDRQSDAQGRVTRWEYDSLGRETARVLPGGQSETKTYDAAGQLITATDFNGQTTTYSYDAAGRLVRTEYVGGRVESFTYDAAGNRTAMTSTEGTTNWSFDGRNRVRSETQPNGATIEYAYDVAGQRTLTRYRQGSDLSESRYGFDALGRISSAEQDDGTATVYSFDAAGNLIEEMQGDTLTRYGYDSVSRLIDVHSTTGGVTTQRYQYTLDAMGRSTRIDETAADGGVHATDYVYDALGRLVEVTEHIDGSLAGQSRYGYDDVGNRVSVEVDGAATAAAFDTNDRLISQGDESYVYDANGNQIRKSSAGGVVDYVYDARNQMVAANDAASGLSVQFDYDADGNRIARRVQVGVSTDETHFVVDRSFGLPEVIAEVDGSDQVIARYLHGRQLIQQTTSDGGENTLRYPLRDGLGSTRYLVDEQGDVTDAFRFDAWGTPSKRVGSTPTAHRFAGEYWEGELGLSYNRARWYAPEQARFTQMDEWRGLIYQPGTLHDYAYVLNAPVFLIDPTGWNATLSETSLASNINAILSTGAQSSYRVVLRKVGRELMCVAVEEVVQVAVVEALTGGIYVLVDAGGLYAGKTGDFDRRLAQHAKDITKNIERTLARFHFEGKGNNLRLLEQFFMNFLRNQGHDLTNKVNAIRASGGSLNTRNLRQALGKLDFCK